MQPLRQLLTHYPLILAGLVVGTMGASCLGPGTTDKSREAELRAFESAEELRDFLAEQARNRNTSRNGGGLGWLDWLFSPTMATSDQAEANGSLDDASGDLPYSTTNIQEAGVDESDLLKNDGQTIYWLAGNTVHIVDAQPPEAMTELATVEIASTGDSLYLVGQTLLALSRQQEYYWLFEGTTQTQTSNGIAEDGTGNAQTSVAAMVGGPWNDGSQATVTAIDISDPANPVVTGTVKLEGQLVTSRLVDGKLHVVLTTEPRLPDEITADTLDDMSLEEWLPQYQITTADGQTTTSNLGQYWNYYRPVVGDGYGITTVVSLDVENLTGGFEVTALTADAGTIYASTEALYVSDVEYDWDFSSYRTDTMIHKLTFTETGTEYAASGLVPGRPLNQYSLGEYNGYLRIATTSEGFSGNGTTSSNGVYVLGQSEGDLNIVGQLEELGLGETIYAARFIGTRGFLVTFKRIDPLFTMDLSDPTNPQLVGTLKVPGYSDHIQLMDENHLLTIGKDAEPAGNWGAWVQGVQLSIFDVTDMSDPQLLHKEIIGGRGTWSEANDNPKAFTYLSTTGKLTFPIQLYSEDTTGPVYGDHEFTGLLVYDVDLETGFEQLGRISAVDETVTSGGCHWNYYGSMRGAFIGQTVYAISDVGVKAADLSDLSDVSTVISQVDFAESPIYEDCFVESPSILPEIDEGLR